MPILKLRSINYLFIYFSFLNFTIGQEEYIPFINEGSQWDLIHGTYYYPNPNDLDHAVWIEFTRRYFFQGDTIINNQEYTKLMFISNSMLTSETQIEYCCAFREEDRKVYLLKPLGVERLLYDFTMDLGDTLLTSTDDQGNNPYAVIVASTDSIQLLDGTYRFRLQFESTIPGTIIYPFEWIEGIGKLVGGLRDLLTPLLFYEETFLCYKKNEQLLLQSELGEQLNCEAPFVSNLSDPINNKLYIQVYPNPAKYQAKFLFQTPGAGEICLFNSAGIPVSKHKISKLDYKIDLDLSLLSAGLYYCQIILNDGRRSHIEKFILH